MARVHLCRPCRHKREKRIEDARNICRQRNKKSPVFSERTKPSRREPRNVLDPFLIFRQCLSLSFHEYLHFMLGGSLTRAPAHVSVRVIVETTHASLSLLQPVLWRVERLQFLKTLSRARVRNDTWLLFGIRRPRN